MEAKKISLVGLYYQGKDDEMLRVLNIYCSMKGVAADLKKALQIDSKAEVRLTFDPNEQDRFGRSIFNLLLDAGKEELSLALWRAGADEMKADGDGEIPLFQAIRKHHTELVMAIVGSMVADARGETDLNLYATEELGKFSAFSLAAVLSNLNVVKAMLEAGANPLAQDDFVGETPLYYAAEDGRADIVALMLKFLPENPRKDLLKDAKYAAPGDKFGEVIVDLIEDVLEAL